MNLLGLVKSRQGSHLEDERRGDVERRVEEEGLHVGQSEALRHLRVKPADVLGVARGAGELVLRADAVLAEALAQALQREHGNPGGRGKKRGIKTREGVFFIGGGGGGINNL